jgi:sugar phosphate isomerase/epimerase
MYKVGINFDEISDDLDTAIAIMKQNAVPYGELRTLNQKNFVFWTDEEIMNFMKDIEASGIEVVAAATPLFKWYAASDDPEVVHDNFGFNPRLSKAEKIQTIDRTIEIAARLKIPRLRIFSSLGTIPNAGEVFARDELLEYTLNRAEEHDIDLFLENEPVCRVHTKQDIVKLLATNQHRRLKFWFDIANLIEIGEELDEDFLRAVTPRLGYLHIKDFVIVDGRKQYVPASEGIIDYESILSSILAVAPDVIITVETHAPIGKKIEYSERSIIGTNTILGSIKAEKTAGQS